MIFKFLQQKVLQKKYNHILAQEKNQILRDAKIKTVAILLGEQQSILIEDIVDQLGISSQNIIILKYRTFDKEKEELPLFFTENDFNWQGGLKSNNLKNFVKKEFDLLINYNCEPNLYLNIITLLSKATFKTGFANIEDKLFNLVISEPSLDIHIFNKELKKYLMILNKL